MTSDTILQVVPRTPGSRDGVGDYARQLGLSLRQSRGWETLFLSQGSAAGSQTEEGFQIRGPLRDSSESFGPAVGVVLHYVNYGYDARGVPGWLPGVVGRLMRNAGGRLVTVFHEVYAAGTWRQSAFWLRPWQKRIACSLAGMSTLSIVSNDVQGDQLRLLAPHAHLAVHPVMSNFGEPDLVSAAIAGRDPHRWVICGGNELITRSTASFLKVAASISDWCKPSHLCVIGGDDRTIIRQQLAGLQDVATSYYPAVAAEEASTLLGQSAFGWIDYFAQVGVPMEVILKSTAYAALCAHGVIPVFPHPAEWRGHRNDILPGPFFVTHSEQRLPSESQRSSIGEALHAWYGRNASSRDLANAVASAIDLAR